MVDELSRGDYNIYIHTYIWEDSQLFIICFRGVEDKPIDL